MDGIDKYNFLNFNESDGESEMKVLSNVSKANSGFFEAKEKALLDTLFDFASRTPRNEAKSLNKMERIATMNVPVAESCFYALPRKKKNGQVVLIEGASVRFAEIVVSCWGNLIIKTNIIDHDNMHVTVQGHALDTERGIYVTQEVKRPIADKTTETGLTNAINAASSVAYRNVVYKIVPTVLTNIVLDSIKQAICGKKENFAQVKEKAIKFFTDQGIKKHQIIEILEVESLDYIDHTSVIKLRGIANAIAEGATTLKDAFYSRPNNGHMNMKTAFDIPEEDEKQNGEQPIQLNDQEDQKAALIQVKNEPKEAAKKTKITIKKPKKAESTSFETSK